MFLRASAAAFGATVGIAAAHSFAPEAVALASEGTASKEKKSKGATSKGVPAARCPVTGKNVSKEASLDYRGGEVYFYSAACIDRFREHRAKYEAKANAQLVVTGQFKQIQCPMGGGEIDPDITMKIGGVEVCFCCEDCLEEVKRASLGKRVELVFGKGFDTGFTIAQQKTAGRGSSAAAPAADKWQCVVCGYAHKGSTPPAKCPKCGAKSESFVASRSAPAGN